MIRFSDSHLKIPTMQRPVFLVTDLTDPARQSARIHTFMICERSGANCSTRHRTEIMPMAFK